MTSAQSRAQLERTPTGISGLDEVMMGGLPSGRTTLVTGTSGSGKTVLATEFLAHGIADFGEPGVFVTFESPQVIRDSLLQFGFPVGEWEREERWAFLELPTDLTDSVQVVGRYDFGALIARIQRAVERTHAKRIVVDSLGGLFATLPDERYVRLEMFRIAQALARMGVTAMMTSERREEYGGISLHGVEEFVLDNVLVLRNVLDEERRRRTVEVVKFRGAAHHTGEWLFTIDPRRGITVLPLAFMTSPGQASDERVSTGVAELDDMCGGGLFRDAIALVRGTAGSGKTLLALRFLAAAFQAGHRCLLVTFDESRAQVVREAAGWGVDLSDMERAGLLRLRVSYPETESLEEHFLALKREIEEFRPDRFVMDPLSAIARIAPRQDILDFVVALTAILRERAVTTLFASSLGDDPGVPFDALGLGGASSLVDVLILLHYQERGGRLERSIAVPQVRGSDHDRTVRPLVIDSAGLHIETAERVVPDARRPVAAWPFEAGEPEGGNL
jgi:circadian clock protein KaiC